MKRLIAACMLGAVLSAGAAFADTMDSSYGNTIQVTTGSGAVVRYFFEPDGSFTAVTQDNQQMAGRWELADGQICLLAPSGQRNCAEFVPGKNVGDTWEQTGTDGSTISVSLVAGR
jgi:hypothetical protein